MKKVEMIRCYVASPHPNPDNPESQERSVRYVPSDIYRLWRYLMEEVKGFTISQPLLSFWVDEEMYSKDKSVYGEHSMEKVVEVSFLYYRESDVGRPIIRYFPHEHLENILNFFLKNFSEDYIQGAMNKAAGFFIVRR